MNKKIYQRGARKEYKLIYDLRKEGFDIAQRTAGSHSPIDILAIKIKDKWIKLIQSKRTLSENMGFTDEELKKKIEAENSELNGTYRVEFEVK